MTTSNIANGGSTHYDLDIQVVATSDTQYTLRAVIYLTSLNVSDSVNNLSVTGHWSRSGALGLSGAYSATPVWYQDIVVNRVYGSGVTVTVNAAWSNVEYWGVTLSASTSYTVPARPGGVPSQVAKPTIQGVSATGVAIWWPAPYDGGSAILDYQVQVATSSTFASGIVVNQTGITSAGWFYGLTYATTYYARVRARNALGYGAWSVASNAFTTTAILPSKVTVLSAISEASDSIKATWAAPNNGGSAITGYGVQVSLTSTFAVVAASATVSASPTYKTLAGLIAATGYFVRVRAKNAIGDGPWSTVLVPVTTLPGVRIGDAGTFRNVRVRIGSGGALVAVKPHIGYDESFT